MNPVKLIIDKREGGEASSDEIHALIGAYTRGTLPDYQMSAWLMAAFLRGLSDAESTALTDAMLHSGEIVDLTSVAGIKVDKHSTGGVGDKVSLALAPLVAACGVPVPMISGRGLAFSGGTLDKLESIPGFRTNHSLDEFRQQIEAVSVAMIGQTEEIAPADRKLYALRDVTGTVEFAPFITASIMSKKLAEGIDGLVLDVKCGQGAFMTRLDDARDLARRLVDVAHRFGKEAVALVTRMDAPLGYAVGNWPEVREAVGVLQGETVPDVTELTVSLAGEMLALGGVVRSPEEGEKRARAAVEDGSGFEKLAELVLAQGGDPWALESTDPHPVSRIEIRHRGPSGFVGGIDARAIGFLGVDIGAGRRRMDESVDPGAGISFAVRVGGQLDSGDLIATIFTNATDRASEFEKTLRSAVVVSEQRPEERDLVLERVA